MINDKTDGPGDGSTHLAGKARLQLNSISAIIKIGLPFTCAIFLHAIW